MTKTISRSTKTLGTDLLGDSSRIYLPHVNALGPLEKTIMEYVWEHGEVTVPEVHKALRKNGRDLAYNTVMMTTTRLATKGYLNQDRSNIMFVYTPAVSPQQYRSGLVERIMDKLVAFDSEAVIRHLATKAAE